jgi:hypothetical protein
MTMADKNRILTKLLVLVVLAVTLHTTNGGTTVVFDLSHQPHLNRRTVTDTIQSTLAGRSDVNCIDLDVSNSEMGNTGLVEMLKFTVVSACLNFINFTNESVDATWRPRGL